ncbi:hypothetical protein [Mycobacterium sp. DL592]|uniref:hypothetical protein n=1 Tax=Mycobacterium sp. DL592 TaxID=2675524 RepID=UPI001424275E|nr:hypothetical protein [Mycobacterium sp. DL592]
MSTDPAVRTAVVFVHGLLERRPMDTFDTIAKTVLAPRNGRWDYHPLALESTDSYEARRYSTASVDLFEYDWSFLMTSTRYAGFGSALLRVFVRRPRHVPDQIFGIWRAAWLAVLIPTAVLVALAVVGGYLLHTGIPGWILGVVSSVVVLSIALAVFRMLPRALTRSFLTTGFVNVARYFDLQPESHVARRAIRGGLVDLLHTLQQGRYARVVVVGHGLGGFIAYDALTTLWAETHQLRAEAAGPGSLTQPDVPGSVEEFQAEQFALWQRLRSQGNPWRTTDFVTLGTPMAFADLFVARPPILAGAARTDRRHALFESLARRGVVVCCPPLPDESGDAGTLGGLSPFAVTRWTNIWFPVTRGSVRGDWFGGGLAPLFGPGIRDIAVTGNRPERLRPGVPQTKYFAYPDRGDVGDVAVHLRSVLALDERSGLAASVSAPEPDPSTVDRVVYRSWQRSM